MMKAEFRNPLLVKIMCLAYGVDISEISDEFPGVSHFLVSLGSNTRIRLNRHRTSSAILKLAKSDKDFSLQYQNGSQRVEILQDNGLIKDSMKKYISASGSALFITPRGGVEKIFNPLGEEKELEKEKEPDTEELLDALYTIVREKKIDTIFFSDPFNKEDDRGIFGLQPYIRLISRNFKSLIAAHVSPPLRLEWIDWTYAIGVDIIWYDLLCFEKDYLNKISGNTIEHERTIESLKHAVSVFPKGCVFTSLFAGIEPVQNTERGIESLLKNGVIPVLRTDPRYSISVKKLLKLYERLHSILKSAKMDTTVIRHMDHLVTPHEISKLFAHGKSVTKNLYETFTESLKDSAVRNIYKLRRNLRVRELT